MKNLYIFLLYVIACAISFGASAQGCVAVRQMGGVNPLSSNGYTLGKHELQIGANYRYFHSWRHFVGREEQPQRQTTGGGHDENGKELGNAVNIYSHAVDINLSYGITDRFQFNLSLPYVHNERSQVFRADQKVVNATDTFRYSLYAKGIGDIRMSTSYWVFDPAKATNGNLQIGVGVKLNSGSHTRSGLAPVNDAATKSIVWQTQTMDQAIQPGDGGIGFSLELQGFRKLSHNIYAFGSGYYLFNPRENNGSHKNPTINSGYDLYASPDQYFARLGAMLAFGKMKNIVASLAYRVEGIPAYDKFGGQVAYRRPGYVMAVEGGISYRKGPHSISVFIPYNFVKNRIQSAADIYNTVKNDAATLADPVKNPKKEPAHGDAAFADYSLNIAYSFRIGKLF